MDWIVKYLVPLTKHTGKFRLKRRVNNNEYGIFHFSKQVVFDENTYVEWQMGYDTKISDIESKPTILILFDLLGQMDTKSIHMNCQK